MPWFEFFEKILLLRTSMCQKFKEINLNFKKYQMHWCFYLINFHNKIQNKYAHDYSKFKFEW